MSDFWRGFLLAVGLWVFFIIVALIGLALASRYNRRLYED